MLMMAKCSVSFLTPQIMKQPMTKCSKTWTSNICATQVPENDDINNSKSYLQCVWKRRSEARAPVASNSHPNSPMHAHHLQESSQVGGILSTCLDDSLKEARHGTGHNRSPINTSSIAIHSANPCNNSPRLLREHIPNPWLLPARRTRAAKAWELYNQEVALQATAHPDLEIYHRCFIVAGQDPRTSLAPAPHRRQRFKKAVHQHLLMGN